MKHILVFNLLMFVHKQFLSKVKCKCWIKSPMKWTQQKTVVFNIVNNVRMCFSSILIHYWRKNSNKVSSCSPLKMGKQEVTLLSLVTWQEVVPLHGNKTSSYYSFKMNIKVQNMCQTCILIIRTLVCNSFICLEKVHYSL